MGPIFGKTHVRGREWAEKWRGRGIGLGRVIIKGRETEYKMPHKGF
jgi:hypothetical protein